MADPLNEPDEFWLFGYGFPSSTLHGGDLWQSLPMGFTAAIPVEGYDRGSWDRNSKEGVCFVKAVGSLIEEHQTDPTRFQIDGYQAMWKVTCADSGSEDHRGTPEAPGRVLTLIEKSYWETLNDTYTAPEPHVWGVAYRIAPSKVAEVKAYLDIREINGYSIQYTPFHPAPESSATSSSSKPSSPSPITCLVYIGLPSNPQFVGLQEPQSLAEHIYRSKGPSGENREYLHMLDQALRDLSPQSGDGHVRDLAERVRGIEKARRAEIEAEGGKPREQ